MALKLVLVGPKGTVYKDGTAKTYLIRDLVSFIRRMDAEGVKVAIWARHPTLYTVDGKQERVEAFLTRASGVNVAYYQAAYGQLPDRKVKNSAAPILKSLAVAKHEAMIVGNEHTDMVAGVHNQLLLVRPEWYPTELTYGFAVNSLAELERFCVLFGLRRHPIFWAVDHGTLKVRSMGPFSTFLSDFADFGASAKAAAKQGIGERFWFLLVVSSLYFSGLIHEVDLICTFPSHAPVASEGEARGLDEVMMTLGRCFGKTYYPDLLVRHKAADKSQWIKAELRSFRNQLNTLQLNPRPHRYDRPPARSPISLKGKRVLVVDDFCTAGRSLDTARAYIEAAGGAAILFSWLKTISASFTHMTDALALAPFKSNVIEQEPFSRLFPYQSGIVDHDAPAEIQATMNAYRSWKID